MYLWRSITMDIIKLESSLISVVNFAMQQNYVPIIKNLYVHNLSEEDLKDIDIVISVEPEFAHTWSTRIESIPSLQSVEIEAINLQLSPNFLYSLTEKLTGTIKIEAKKADSIIHTSLHQIDVLAYDEWSGSLIMLEIITAFVTPNHPKVTEVIVKASEILQKWRNNLSFNGYQSNNPNTIRLQMAAIYTALQQQNISYSMPPASFELVGQRVRLCDQVLAQKMGTCLDLSLLYASCLEAVGLHPLIIFLKGHAFVGCWLEEMSFSECVLDDLSLLTKRIAEGIHEICLVESTCFVSGKSISFDEAVKVGERNLINENQFDFFVDVKRTRISGIRPIPLRKVTADGKLLDIKFEENNAQNGKTKIGEAPSEIQKFESIEEVSRIEVSRMQIWERKLLDLSLRNTLLNFRVTKSAVQLMVSNLSELEDALASGQEFQIMPKPKDWENTLRDTKIYEVEHAMSALENLAKHEFSQKRIRTFLEEHEVSERITYLYRQSKLSIEENGTNTLYLALGFLKWYESDVSEKERYAPLVLIPIEVVRKSTQKGYVIRTRDEEAQMNITLLEMLRQDFGLTIGGLDPLPTDESGIDLKRVFHVMRRSVMAKSRWDVEELAFIGLFSFSQFIMWNDLRNRAEDLKRNKIVASLMSGKMEWQPSNDFPTLDTLDEDYSPLDLAVPISADSSQLSAIVAAGKGNSFVLHGPPGTGKSQTITNIIANALFQGKTDLEKLINRRNERRALNEVVIDDKITDRYYQKEAIRAVCESIERGQRKALLVMATGTGKTRTAASLTDVLSRGGYVTNVLFLADRTELVDQAKDSFKNCLPDMSLCNLLSNKEDKNARIVFSTYHTMLNIIDSAKNEEGLPLYTPAHFDLIIIDEAHRSIFNKFKVIFDYFDAIMVGLTATPKMEVDRNTYEFFELENGVPTYAYDYETAVEKDKVLVPYYNIEVTTKFMDQGIIYDQLSVEDKERYEEDFADDEGAIPDHIPAEELNRYIFNQSTIDMVIQDLMTKGIKVADGDRIGKTIIFAQNDDHAQYIVERFNKLYPQYNGTFARRITYRENYVKSLIADFKVKDKEPHIAVSVDMLDTGIDVPEVVNLVFFKSVRSKTKFWQMIGRGTRTCKNLFGDGKDKAHFVIFDYMRNFEFFRQHKEGIEGSDSKSVTELIFSKRVRIIHLLQQSTYSDDAYQQFRKHLVDETVTCIRALNTELVSVRMQLKHVEKYQEISSYTALSDSDIKNLAMYIAPLVFIDEKDDAAKRFDNFIYGLMLAQMEGTSSLKRYKHELISTAQFLLDKRATVPAVKDNLDLNP